MEKEGETPRARDRGKERKKGKKVKRRKKGGKRKKGKKKIREKGKREEGERVSEGKFWRRLSPIWWSIPKQTTKKKVSPRRKPIPNQRIAIL